jgi:hypothetical protein
MSRARCRTWVTGRNAGELNLSFLLERTSCPYVFSRVTIRYSEVILPAFDSELSSQPSLQEVMVFIALPNNEVPTARHCPPPRCSSFFCQSFIQDYLGPATELSIANHISACHGPSGSNVEYALKLAVALERLGVFDPHVRAVARHLNSMGFSADVSK